MGQRESSDMTGQAKDRGPGNTKALGKLMELYPTFKAYLTARVGNVVIAEDLLQQSLTRAIEHQHTVKNDESVVNWFYRILRNASIDYYRSHAAEARRDRSFLDQLERSGDDKVPSIDEAKSAICICLNQVLDDLRPNYAEMIRRVDLNGEPITRVAAELQTTPSTLTVRLHRARQALRASLEQSCGVCSKHGCLNCTCG